MRESQHAVYRNEMARLHRQSDNQNATIQILRDALTAQRANHSTEVARVRREMAPGFSWPDPDGVPLLLAKIDSQQATMTKMAAKMAKTSAQNARLKARIARMEAEIARMEAEIARMEAGRAAEKEEGADKLSKVVAELAGVVEERDALRRLCDGQDADEISKMAAELAGVVEERDALRRLCDGQDADKLARATAELEKVAAERDALRALYNSRGHGQAMTMAELEKVAAERDALRNLYAHHNTAGKNPYTERRSKVNRDIREIEEEIAGELGTSLDAEREKAAAGDGAGDGAGRAEGQCRGRAGSSHSNKPDETVWHTRTQCPRCQAVGCLVRKSLLIKLVSDFFEDRMWLRTACHIGVIYDCAACGGEAQPDLPGIRGTAFGKKALSLIVQLGGRKNVDADIAEMFGDMFSFPTGETTIWNARLAAADLLEHTMAIIRNALRSAKHLGIDETYYSCDGDSGYVWVVRTNKVTFVLAMSSRGEDVIEKYMSDLLHIPVTTDGYAPYLKHFKILQRCWAHILRAAEAAYVLLDKDDPMRAYYVDLYRRLLQIFRDAKRVAAKTAAGADHLVCARFEERVMDVVAAYGDHGFAATLEGAAPNLFTFLRHPGMPPTNNDTERDIRDAVVVQRKIRRRFVNARGRHVFSVIQSFNSTCRKLGLVPWRCMERIIDDPKYDILQAGDDTKRVGTPWSEAGPATHRLCINGKAVETHGAILNVKKAEKLTAEIAAETAVQGGAETESAVETATPETAVQGGAETESAVETATETNVEVNVAPPSQTCLTNNDRLPPMQPCALGGAGHEQAIDPATHNTRPYRGKPPPAVAA